MSRATIADGYLCASISVWLNAFSNFQCLFFFVSLSSLCDKWSNRVWVPHYKNHFFLHFQKKIHLSMSILCLSHNLSSPSMASDNLPEKWMMSISQITSSLIVLRWWQTGLTVITDQSDWPPYSGNQSVRVMSVDHISSTVHIINKDDSCADCTVL